MSAAPSADAMAAAGPSVVGAPPRRTLIGDDFTEEEWKTLHLEKLSVAERYLLCSEVKTKGGLIDLLHVQGNLFNKVKSQMDDLFTKAPRATPDTKKKYSKGIAEVALTLAMVGRERCVDPDDVLHMIGDEHKAHFFGYDGYDFVKSALDRAGQLNGLTAAYRNTQRSIRHRVMAVVLERIGEGEDDEWGLLYEKVTGVCGWGHAPGGKKKRRA